MAAQDYAHVNDGTVTNVIVLDPEQVDPEWFATLIGGELIPLDDHLESRWGIGWGWDGAQPVPPPVREFTVDPAAIPADGTTAALVTYRDTHDDAPASVTFTVNGATEAVDVTDGIAELEVTGTVPGRIDVTVDTLPDQLVTITVEEA